MNELVTVYMPTHNRRFLVERAVKSVLNQTYKNLELIVCDDGSSDETWEILCQLSQLDDRMVILRNETPLGACLSRNRCIGIAKGKYITGLDDDDYFLPNRIQVLINCIEDKKVNSVCSNLIYKSKEKDLAGERYNGLIKSKDIGYRNIVGNQIFTLTSIFRELNGFDTCAPAWQDYDLWLRLINKSGPCYRTKKITYVMDISHDMERITTSSKAYQGYLYFLDKHKKFLSQGQINSLFLEDKTNRGYKLSFKDIVSHPCKYGVVGFLKNFMKSKFSIIGKVIDNIKMKAM